MQMQHEAKAGIAGAAESLFQSIVVHASDGIVVVDIDGHVTFCNPAFAQLFQRAPDEFAGELFGFPVVDGEATEINVLRKDGSLAIAEMRVSQARAGGERAFIAMLHDITQRKRTEGELREALEAARIADKAKDEFLANITHELRTPLAAVIGFSSLARPLSTDPRQREYLDKVNSAGKTLSAVIDDLLDLSKIVAGRLEFEDKPFSLRQLVERSRSLIGFKAQEKGLELLEKIDDELPDVLIGDSLRVEQILLNLLSNAVKFTAAGRIELCAAVQAREAQRVCLTLEVKDTGIGLSAEEITQLFKPFSQADASMTRKFGGTGLGLAICKRLAEMMGGDIGVSQREGGGSIFKVRLWLGLGSASDLPVAESNTAEDAWVSYQKARVLVVDDQPFNRDIAQGLLAAAGITPHLAENGQVALDIISSSEESFDLILMDLQMPVMDGLTATRAIRMRGDCAELPIIAMTAHTMAHERQKCIAAGMNDHIGKPFNEAGFFRVLAKWIPRSKQQLQAAIVPRPISNNGLPLLTGVDTVAGLALLMGDEARYRHWLTDFVAEAPEAMKQIRLALDAGNATPASLVAHTLKGRMGLLGMTGLHVIAAALEAAIEGAVMATALANTQASQLLLDLERGVAVMCAEIRNGLGMGNNPASVTEPPLGNPPAGLPPESVTRLIAGLHAGDSDCDRLLDDCLAELGDTAWAPHLRQTLQHIQNFDYAAAVVLLSGTPLASAQGPHT
jgi:signal transduction histidine kinase/CheY-like chemotaxis protein/HPt (histidine-containing phosphotransfer) domain-containing protein